MPLGELGSKGAAGRLALIVGGVVTDDGVDQVDACLVGVRLLIVHPFAFGPRIRAKEDDLLVAEGLLDFVPHRLELIVFKLLGAHGGATEGEGIIVGGPVGREVGAGDDFGLGARGRGALGNEVCHGLGVARAAPVDDGDLAHIESFRLCGVRPRFVRSIGSPGQGAPSCSPADR